MDCPGRTLSTRNIGPRPYNLVHCRVIGSRIDLITSINQNKKTKQNINTKKKTFKQRICPNLLLFSYAIYSLYFFTFLGLTAVFNLLLSFFNMYIPLGVTLSMTYGPSQRSSIFPPFLPASLQFFFRTEQPTGSV